MLIGIDDHGNIKGTIVDNSKRSAIQGLLDAIH